MELSADLKKEAIALLHQKNYACVIVNHGVVRTFTGRGVSDLYKLLKTAPNVLNGSFVADKVIGKGAAALMILGGVKEVYTDLISVAALQLFQQTDIKVDYAKKVEGIQNRAGTGPCPVESLCRDCRTAHECLPLIDNFITNRIKDNN